MAISEEYDGRAYQYNDWANKSEQWAVWKGGDVCGNCEGGVHVKSNPVRYKQYLLSKGRKHKADAEIKTNENNATE